LLYYIEQKDKSTAKMQCCFCDKVFTGGALRIREHLSGNGNVMIKACRRVPDDIAEIMRTMLKEKKMMPRLTNVNNKYWMRQRVIN